jgi:hypothetical protein
VSKLKSALPNGYEILENFEKKICSIFSFAESSLAVRTTASRFLFYLTFYGRNQYLVSKTFFLINLDKVGTPP